MTYDGLDDHETERPRSGESGTPSTKREFKRQETR